MHIYTPLGLGRDNIPEDCDETSHLGSELCHCIADIVWSTHTLSADFWGQRQGFLGSQEVKQQRTRYRTVSISEFEGKNLNPYEMHPPCISLMFGNISGFWLDDINGDRMTGWKQVVKTSISQRFCFYISKILVSPVYHIVSWPKCIVPPLWIRSETYAGARPLKDLKKQKNCKMTHKINRKPHKQRTKLVVADQCRMLWVIKMTEG